MRALFISALLLLLAPVVSAQPFSSAEYGYAADFPCTPEEQRDPGQRVNGQLVSDSATVACQTENQYFVGMSVDRYYTGAHPTLESIRDAYLRGFNGSGGRSASATIGGHSALLFTFQSNANPNATGRGMVVFVDGQPSRYYTVVLVRGPNTTPEALAVADHFLDSFRVLH